MEWKTLYELFIFIFYTYRPAAIDIFLFHQWFTHWVALSQLACGSRHTPRPNHFPPVFKGQGTKFPILVLRFFKNPANWLAPVTRMRVTTLVGRCSGHDVTCLLNGVTFTDHSLMLCLLRLYYEIELDWSFIYWNTVVFHIRLQITEVNC